MKAQTLVDSLSELMVDASLGTIQCLEEIVSNYCPLMTHLMFWMLYYRSTFFCIMLENMSTGKLQHNAHLKGFCMDIFLMSTFCARTYRKAVIVQIYLCRCRSSLPAAAISNPQSFSSCGRDLLVNGKLPS